MVKIVVIIAAVIGGLFLYDHYTDDPREIAEASQEPESCIIDAPDVFVYNQMPYKSDSEFKLFVFKKYDHHLIKRIIWIRGATITGKEIIRYAVIWLSDKRQ